MYGRAIETTLGGQRPQDARNFVIRGYDLYDESSRAEKIPEKETATMCEGPEREIILGTKGSVVFCF